VGMKKAPEQKAEGFARPLCGGRGDCDGVRIS
jgi:hypothetical protein